MKDIKQMFEVQTIKRPDNATLNYIYKLAMNYINGSSNEKTFIEYCDKNWK